MLAPQRRSLPSFQLTAMFLLGSLISIIGEQKPWPGVLPSEISSLDADDRIRADAEATTAASTDFGRLTWVAPAAVFFPTTEQDIAALLRFAYELERPPGVAARGHGHSVWGQASAPAGIVIDMRSLNARAGAGGDRHGAPPRRRLTVVPPGQGLEKVSGGGAGSPYVDAGGEQLWAEVLHETLKSGLAPKSWTDYLYLTVGGTLSNAGVSGQTSLYGPQISNVYELDVVTGKGEMLTCSGDVNPDLFYAVLGGLGQFGVITRARIALAPAPQRARWVRLIYTDFAAFTGDQEFLISLDGKVAGAGEGMPTAKQQRKGRKGFDYVEGSVFQNHGPIGNWRSTFFSEEDSRKISALAARHGTVYCLEAAMYYGAASPAHSVEQDVGELLKELRFVPGFVFANDVSYVSFLNRVREGELRLRTNGLWDVPHPWLNLFVPKSGILDFDAAVFRGILKHNGTMGPILVYPLRRDKWDERMSAVIPEEEEGGVFYSVGLLWSAAAGSWEQVEHQNAQVLRYCEQAGIGVKQYLPHYGCRSEWMKHFGPKWERFVERKKKYDPKALLSPGQGIFTAPLL